jgi:hypothetical protein
MFPSELQVIPYQPESHAVIGAVDTQTGEKLDTTLRAGYEVIKATRAACSAADGHRL